MAARSRKPFPPPSPHGGGPHGESAHPARCFVCGTNRPQLGIGGQTLEALMHNRRCAAMWEYPPGSTERVRILGHMQRVECADLILMFATGEGIIGVGRAAETCHGPLGPGAPARIRGPEWLGMEWQVPVQWLRWQPDTPCPFRGWNATFYDVTGILWDGRREAALQFFGLG